MRVAAVILLCAACAACSGVEGDAPPMMGANEMQQRPGVFSGPGGQFVLTGENYVDPTQ